MADTLIYKCPNCGAILEYDASNAVMVCDHCHSTFSPAQAEYAQASDGVYQQAAQTQADMEFENQVASYSCQSCGAEILADPNTSATFCPYCGASAILPAKLSGIYRPAAVIPFKISKEEAQTAFRKWCHNGRFTPRDFAAPQEMEKLTGIYVPFWLFDCTIEGAIIGRGTRVSSYVVGQYLFQNTKHFLIRRRAALQYDKVPADGSERMDDDMMDKLEPYDYNELKDFEMPYLAGYEAEKYDRTPQEVFTRIRSRLDDYTQERVADSVIGFNSVTNVQRRNFYTANNAAYTLLPVWVHRYRYKDQVYQFSMNGQTGKVVGIPPLDKTRVALHFLKYVAGAAALLFAGGMFL